MFASIFAYFFVEVAKLVGEHAVFVCQETEASFFFQEGLSAAVCDKLLHVHLSGGDGLQILRTGKEDNRNQCQKHM